MNEKQLRELNTRYETVKGLLTTFKEQGESLKKDWALKDDDYSNPYRSPYDFERFVGNFRKELIKFLIGRVVAAQCPNVKIEMDSLLSEINKTVGEEAFDAKAIKTFLEGKFVANAEALSIEHLISRVEHLIPRFETKKEGEPWGKRRPATVDDLVQGRKLILDVWTHPTYSKGMEIHYEAPSHISALEIAIQIVLDKADPVTVSDDTALSSLVYANRSECFRRVEYGGKHTEYARFYKNGKFELAFKTEGKARQVAKWIVEHLPKRDY